MVTHFKLNSAVFLTSPFLSFTRLSQDFINWSSWASTKQKWSIMTNTKINVNLTIFSVSESIFNVPANLLQFVILPLQLTHFSLNQLSISKTTLLLATFLKWDDYNYDWGNIKHYYNYLNGNITCGIATDHWTSYTPLPTLWFSWPCISITHICSCRSFHSHI